MGTQAHIPLNFNGESPLFFTDIGHCDLCFFSLGLNFQLLKTSCLSFLPLALRNENQDGQPRCVTSRSSRVGTKPCYQPYFAALGTSEQVLYSTAPSIFGTVQCFQCNISSYLTHFAPNLSRV